MPAISFFRYFRLSDLPGQSTVSLSPFAVLIVTGIMFGVYIWSSTVLYLNPTDANVDATAQQLIDLYQQQLLLLTAAVVYLHIMIGFSVRALPWGVSWRSTLSGLIIFAGLALLADLARVLIGSNPEPTQTENVADAAMIGWSVQLWLATIGHSFFNGIYEEIYFLGIVLAIKRQWLWPVILFSLIVRFSFHTYQGLENAIVAMALGGQMLLLYSWIRRLWPFMVAHMVADVFGLGLIYYLP